MTDEDQRREDDVLRRMLKTPPKPRKDGKKGGKPKPAPSPAQKRVG